MRLLIIFFSLSITFLPINTMAGKDHDHGHSHGDEHSHSHDLVNEDQAKKVASKNVARLAKKGKIDKSWTSVKPSSAEQKKFGKNVEWVVVFNNKNIKDSQKQTLYVFVSLSGKYIAANHSGK